MESAVAQVIVRNLEQAVVDRLKQRAKLKGCSLEQELRRVITEASKATPEEKVAISRRLRAMTPKGVKQVDSAILLREERDRR
jgi:plasmid stability protein